MHFRFRNHIGPRVPREPSPKNSNDAMISEEPSRYYRRHSFLKLKIVIKVASQMNRYKNSDRTKIDFTVLCEQDHVGHLRKG